MIDILGGISHPLTEAGVAGAVGIVALATRRWRSGLALIAAAGAWVYLCATPAFALLLWQGLARQYPPQLPAAYPHGDAIVLVGGGSVPDSFATWNARTDPALSTALGFAVALYRLGKAPVLVAVGDSAARNFQQALLHQGVRPSALILAPGSRTTHQDATYARQVVPPRSAPRILLVSTDMHMPRTLAAFRKQGYRPIPAPALQPAWIAQPQRSWHPRHRMLYISQLCLHEYIGLFYYRLRGWAMW